MMYYDIILVSKKEADTINRYLTYEPKDESECFSEDRQITCNVVFGNDYQMDIMCCGVQYEENASNTAWTQAVLYNNKGKEISYTEPESEFLGEWELEDDNGNTYIVLVKEDY